MRGIKKAAQAASVVSRTHGVYIVDKLKNNDRTPLEINDEYDVQDLVHALLLLHFDDIRPEAGSPSFAGSSSRQDFLLKKEKIVIEVKKTRRSLGANKIGEELLIDIPLSCTSQTVRLWYALCTTLKVG